MPHQCTDCGRTFEDGSKEMLSGCPDCGGNKFQFHPDGVESDSTEPPEPPEPAVDNTVARTVGNAATAVRDLMGSTQARSSTRNAGEEASTQHTDTSTASSTEDTRDPASTGNKPESASATMAETENDAQASARSEVVSPDDIPDTSESDRLSSPDAGETPDPSHLETDQDELGVATEPEKGDSLERIDSANDTDRPDLSELREELNQQFESIRVLNPGQYELNLMELYDREEYIVALQEDGKYTIQVPERWED